MDKIAQTPFVRELASSAKTLRIESTRDQKH
ncbi:hypothetical protein ACJ73_10292 [Blastomyces percursus]|uniref:Uncharacterized protein n=1 Tax=Blastomyces percursus TaxID=1658174 RepID=A0A1J9P0V3_9EURO|nr:hypothetical protein ACJ73_10292 [Blastomyces percursus]